MYDPLADSDDDEPMMATSSRPPAMQQVVAPLQTHVAVAEVRKARLGRARSFAERYGTVRPRLVLYEVFWYFEN